MEETITILKVGTQEAVQSIADLRENVKTLKKTLEETQVDTEEGWKQYQDTLELLKVNQNALKDAMYATTGTFQDVTKAATGASESYNSLVHRMAALKEEFRATNDEARRNELGTKIKEINDKLKDMDALQGNFQRNVGNYSSAFKNWGDQIEALRKGLGAATGGLRGLKDGTEALAKSPAIATFSILVSLVIKLTDAVKDNDKATAALKKGMEALKPVMDFISGILDQVAEFLADIITKVVTFVNSNGLINKIIQGVMGVGNAILKFVIAPFKGIAAAIKVFQEEGVKGLGNAARAFGNEMKSGVSFKENFQAGQLAADTILSGMSSRKRKAKDTGKDLGKSVADGMYEGALAKLKNSEDLANAWREAFATWEKGLSDANKDMMDELQADIDAEFQANLDELTEWVEAQDKARKKDLDNAKATAKAKKDLMKSVASSTSDILGAIADMYETDSENAEKNANKIKALRIAAATIDTISGAIGAFMQATETIPPPYGQIVGAIEAAAITATGIANIAKIKATDVSTKGGASATPSITATASAPALQTRVANVRTITGASEEDRLNRMARDQRVYILASDIQASQDQIKTQVSESSF